ncbi:hypothetical protein JCM33374_g3053 [Metschnikowia sp. JCM 33374]|nr:hypothetical protein JCM33374_g3053 [Metschnikowia sp. JCM 33374]
MPPPTSPDWPESQRTPSTRHIRLIRPALSWAHFNPLNHISAQIMSLDEHVLSGAYFPDTDRMGGSLRYEVDSPNRSDSAETSSSSYDSSSSSQGEDMAQDIASFRHRFEGRESRALDDVTRVLSGIVNEDNSFSDILLSNSPTSGESDNSPVANDSTGVDEQAGPGSSTEGFSIPDAIISNEDSPENHDSSEGSISGTEFPQTSQISPIHRRLLLSSARQNMTNENTIIDSRGIGTSIPDRGMNPIFDGVPLRRQNAIRRRTSSAPTGINEKSISTLKKNLKNILKAIKQQDPSFGASPLFTDRHLWNNSSNVVSKPRCCPHHDYVSLNENLNSVKFFRQPHKLWKSKSFNDGRNTKLPETFSKQILKRACTFDSSDKKRKRIGNGICDKNASVFLCSELGESIYADYLTDSDKDRILSGFSSSYLRSGSSFSVAMDPLQRRSHDVLGLTFSEVCQESSNLNGFFQPLTSDENQNIGNLRNLMSILVGETRMDDGKLLKDTLDEIFKVIGSFCKLPSSKKLDTQFKIPFVGTLIDFKKNDLRFLKDKSDDLGINQRAKNDRIKFQLGEWLRIKPFSDLSESFLLNKLRFAIRCLQFYSDIPKKHQKTIYGFCKTMLDESWLLTKNFASIRSAKIPIIEKSFVLSESELSTEPGERKLPRLGESPFTRKWNSEICDKLGNFVSCTDSCLLNLQLNYVLFTVEVDIYAAVNSMLSIVSKALPDDSSQPLLKIMTRRLKDGGLATKAKKSTLVCSLNRKTGGLELSRAPSETDFKVPISRRRHFSSGNTSYSVRSSNGGAVGVSSTLPHDSVRQQSSAEPSNAMRKRQSSIIYGVPKKGNPVACIWKNERGSSSFV